MDVLRSDDASFDKGDAARFTGDVYARYGPDAADESGITVVVVRFAAGARTFWHSHPGGQCLYILEGKCRVRSQGEDGVVASPGDILYVSPGEVHFHGGSPGAPMMHLAVNGGGAPDWGAEVTDEEYRRGF